MENKLFKFENFDIYQAGLCFVNKIYGYTKNFPTAEKFGLYSQLRRSATSVLLNLAEGFGKYSKKEKIRYYIISRASLYECVPVLTISFNQTYLDKKQYSELYQDCYKLGKRLSGLITSISKRDQHP